MFIESEHTPDLRPTRTWCLQRQCDCSVVTPHNYKWRKRDGRLNCHLSFFYKRKKVTRCKGGGVRVPLLQLPGGCTGCDAIMRDCRLPGMQPGEITNLNCDINKFRKQEGLRYIAYTWEHVCSLDPPPPLRDDTPPSLIQGFFQFCNVLKCNFGLRSCLHLLPPHLQTIVFISPKLKFLELTLFRLLILSVTVFVVTAANKNIDMKSVKKKAKPNLVVMMDPCSAAISMITWRDDDEYIL